MTRCARSGYAILAVLVIASFAGCASVEVAKEGQGTGEKRTYRASVDRVWAAIPGAIAQTGGSVKESDRAKCSVLAEYGVSLVSWGERVGVFCYGRSANETEVEVVSRRAVGMNITASDWTQKIFGILDRELRP